MNWNKQELYQYARSNNNKEISKWTEYLKCVDVLCGDLNHKAAIPYLHRNMCIPHISSDDIRMLIYTMPPTPVEKV
jgi:hypothetical protein